jgi:hypothetical protein
MRHTDYGVVFIHNANIGKVKAKIPWSYGNILPKGMLVIERSAKIEIIGIKTYCSAHKITRIIYSWVIMCGFYIKIQAAVTCGFLCVV